MNKEIEGCCLSKEKKKWEKIKSNFVLKLHINYFSPLKQCFSEENFPFVCSHHEFWLMLKTFIVHVQPKKKRRKEEGRRKHLRAKNCIQGNANIMFKSHVIMWENQSLLLLWLRCRQLWVNPLKVIYIGFSK